MAERLRLSPLQDRKLSHWILLAVLVSIWGSSFALMKVAVETISLEWVVALRMAIGGSILMTLLLIRGERLPLDRAAIAWYCWFGLVGNVLPYYLVMWGIQHVASGLAGILMACIPLFVIALAPFLLPDERLTPAKAAGFAIGFLGVLLLIGPAALGTMAGSGIILMAQLSIIAGASCFALFNISGRYVRDIPLLALSAGALTVAGAAAVPLALVLAPQGLAETSMQSAVAAFFLGTVSTALMTMLLFRTIQTAGSSFTSLASYFTPVYACLIGIVFLGETLGVNVVAGLTLILAGLWVAERRGRLKRG